MYERRKRMKTTASFIEGKEKEESKKKYWQKER